MNLARHLTLHSKQSNIEAIVSDSASPHVFGLPGSGSTSQRYESGSFYHEAKIVSKKH
jgi:hypothetical protein